MKNGTTEIGGATYKVQLINNYSKAGKDWVIVNAIRPDGTAVKMHLPERDITWNIRVYSNHSMVAQQRRMIKNMGR